MIVGMKKNLDRPPLTPEQLAKYLERQNKKHAEGIYDRGAGRGEISKEVIDIHKKYIATTQKPEELTEYFKKNPLFFGNSHKGLDHSEHIIKRIGLAMELGCSRLAPRQLDVRRKVASFIKEQGQKDTFDVKKEAYQQYLSKKYPDIQFSQDELDQVTKKLPIDIFGSLDKGVERIILLLNAFQDTETRFSCAGHNDNRSRLENKGEENSYRNVYISFLTHNKKIVDAIQAFVLSYKDQDNIMQLEDDGDGKYRLFYGIQKPPSEWIKKHGRRTAEQIFLDSKKEIEEIIGQPFPVEVKEGEDLLEKLSEEIEKYKRRLITIETEGDRNKFFDEINKLEKTGPSIQTGNEWREYFLSPEAQQKGAVFFNALEAVLGSLRNK